MTWKLGRIEKLHSSDDGVIRSASVRMSGKGGLLERPIKVLYPLEEDINEKVKEAGGPDQEHQPTVSTDNSDSDAENVDVVEDIEPSIAESNLDPSVGRPRRAAAVKGEQRRKKVQFEH